LPDKALKAIPRRIIYTHRAIMSVSHRSATSSSLRVTCALVAALWILAAGGAAAAAAEPDAAAAADPGAAEPSVRGGEVVLLDADSIVQTVLAGYLIEGIAAADEAEAAAVVIKLSTPGGDLVSTRRISRAILGAATPVVVWVAPSGAQAASAGFFILMSADVAAMAPGTNTGAAHPVAAGGADIEGTMGEKVEQDSAATIRSLATRHGRDVEAAEAAVVQSLSYSTDEAMEAGLIDLVAPSLIALLAEIDGREVTKGGRTVTLATRDAPVREVEMPALKRVLSALASPDLAVILMSLGMLGLYFEFQNPGAILPGVLGAICLILAFFGLSVLPVNYAGVALILLAFVFFFAEIKVASFGLLTLGGVISLVLGAMMLFDSPVPALRASVPVIAGVAIFALLATMLLGRLVWSARRERVRTGGEGLLEQRGRAFTDFGPRDGAVRGKVFVHGEIWNAVADAPIARGAPVRVVAVDGMTLHVHPAGGSAAE
jgi:membrane-bound serine protease (ClpP class)